MSPKEAQGEASGPAEGGAMPGTNGGAVLDEAFAMCCPAASKRCFSLTAAENSFAALPACQALAVNGEQEPWAPQLKTA